MASSEDSTAAESLRFTALFEAEVLTQLLLDRWGHPSAKSSEYAQELLEQAADILRQSARGIGFIENVEPSDMNYIAAAWYAEWSSVANDPSSDPGGRRRAWLDAVRRTFPSCFCDPNELI